MTTDWSFKLSYSFNHEAETGELISTRQCLKIIDFQLWSENQRNTVRHLPPAEFILIICSEFQFCFEFFVLNLNVL